MDKPQVSIRQKFDLGVSGDKAVALRVVRLDGHVWVEVSQTEDAREVTIMSAVNRALDDYEQKTGIKLEVQDGEVGEKAGR